ncbi:hypothetical protein [Aeromonas veronii]|uniref:hypothetical protein n=1 Tax=Aeromonas veronii TaxID=654 RepID=UPI0036723430
MKKIIYNDYFMSEFMFYFLEKKREYDIQSVANQIKSKKLPLLLKLFMWRVVPFGYIFLFLVVRCFQKKQMTRLSKDSILYFGVDNIYNLTKLMYGNVDIDRHVLWFWNPISSLGVNKYDNWVHVYLFIPLLKYAGVQLWSFDKCDVEKHKLIYHPQIHNSAHLLSYSLPHMTNFKKTFKSDRHSFLFVGKDKGRLKNLINVKSILSKSNVDCELYITPDEKGRYSNKDFILLEEHNLSYIDYLKKVSSHSGLIDFVQAGQSGVTLRALEALYLRKKLITNNHHIKEYDFYHPSNVLFIDESMDSEQLLSFLDSSFVDVSPDVLAKYDINDLLNSVFE